MIKKRLMGLCLIMAMSFPITAFAATANTGVSTTVPIINNGSVITPDSTSCPDKGDLYTNGEDYSVSGSADHSDLYTNKCFKGVSSISFEITNNRSKSLTVNLCSYTALGNVNYGVQTIKIPANSTTSSKFSDLSRSKYYFLEFCDPSDFDGTVCGNK